MQQPAALEALTRRLAYSFNNPALLDEALTHRSVGAHNNERLEFLGDSVLNFVIADELFRKFSKINEGDLSRLRASLVNRDSLADIARELDLGACLKLGSGELKSGGFRRSSIIADAVESVLGAVYCDSGFEACRQLVLRLYKHKLDNIPDIDSLKDAKTRLQELLQSRHYERPEYNVVEVSGKAHAQSFKVECRMQDPACVTIGEGRSRRKAEQLAAEAALEILHQQLKG
jgi:ribonuclease-3